MKTSAPPPSELVDLDDDAPRAIRARLTGALAKVVGRVAAPISLALIALAVWKTGWSGPLVGLALLQVAAGALLVLWRPREPRHLSLALFAYGYLHANLATLQFGPAIGVGVLVVMGGVWSALTLGRRGVWLTAALVFASSFGTGAALEAELLPRPNPLMLDVRLPQNWVRMAAMMAAGGMVVAWLVDHLLGEYLRAALRAERTLATEERERALSDEVVRQLHHSQRLETLHRLAGGAGHDIMNALAVVLCNAEMLRRSDDAFEEELASEVLEAATSAAKTSRQLMALGEREPTVAGSTEPAALVERLGRLLRRSLPTSIEVRLEAKTDRAIAMSTEALERLLLNLCLNARDAMPEGGHLDVTVSSVEAGLRRGGTLIEVADTGCGMDEATRDRVFEPFFTTKGPGAGTGMGLAIVHGLVTSALGAISVASRPGDGTTFRVELPPASHGAQPTHEAPAAQASAEGRTILLVEDDVRVRSVMRRVLRAAGHQVIAADTGAAAISAMAGRAHFDLLITDGVLPDQPTQALIDALLARHPAARVVVCSGYSDEVLSQRGIDLERCERLPKPFTAAELRAVAGG